MSNRMNKVVLVSENGYSDEHDKLLESFLDQNFELFCAVGKDCELWEEMMDEIAAGNGENVRYITTTSHPDESENEVVEFAHNFTTSSESEVKIVRI